MKHSLINFTQDGTPAESLHITTHRTVHTIDSNTLLGSTRTKIE